MKTIIVLALSFVLIGVVCAAGYKPAMDYWIKQSLPKWREAEVTKGRIVSVVNSTGTIKPVLSVQVGTFVSGPIKELFVDFNQEVKKGQLLAQIDPRIYDALVAQQRALLATHTADVVRAEAQFHQSENNEKRAMSLREENKDFVSQQELDQLVFNRKSMEALVDVAKASIKQAEAGLANAQANLDYTEIRSPVDGIVIDRKIDPGQTLAAQFQTPQLFVIAPDMRKKMHVFASVDEADIGLIREAQRVKRPVHFTVDAYPDDLFEGAIEEIRFSSTETQNIVTYPVVVAAPNPDLKLLPGMTASISFRVDERDDVIKLPNAALRFYPQSLHVRQEDRKLLEGKEWKEQTEDTEEEKPESNLSAEEKAEARRVRNRRHVWVAGEKGLRAVEVVTGLSDSKYTELSSGDLKAGDKVVTGIEPKKPYGSQ